MCSITASVFLTCFSTWSRSRRSTLVTPRDPSAFVRGQIRLLTFQPHPDLREPFDLVLLFGFNISPTDRRFAGHETDQKLSRAADLYINRSEFSALRRHKLCILRRFPAAVSDIT